jgi:hypothetical protein
MPAPVIIGTSTSFGIENAESGVAMQITNVSANNTSNRAEAKNINGGVAAVMFNGKKVEHTYEGFYTTTNSLTVGDAATPSNQLATELPSAGYYVEEVTATRTSEDFVKIRYLLVQRDGIA